jgi:SAM-dependent methyltransferase
MEIIKRSQCLLTGTEDIEPIYSFKKFPVYMGCVDPNLSNNDLFCDMEWGCSKSSGSVQLMNLIDPTLLYQEHHNPGTVGKTWQHHHETFYDFIKDNGYNTVLEIGGASGTLVKHFLPEVQPFTWTIVEPSNQTGINDPRVNYAQGYFETYPFDTKFDTIVHSHVFEHVYDPLIFLEKINNLLAQGGDHYISVPNMRYWLEQGFTNTLMFEHTFYLDENVLEYLLNHSGFKILDKIIQPHSIFVHCIKDSQIEVITPKFDYIKELYLGYVAELEIDVATINEKIGDHSFFLFGAHIFSQVLINLGLRQEQIAFILDNDLKKQEQRLYGTNLIVKSPNILHGINSPKVVLRGGVYTNEIKESILKVNPTVIFY